MEKLKSLLKMLFNNFDWIYSTLFIVIILTIFISYNFTEVNLFLVYESNYRALPFNVGEFLLHLVIINRIYLLVKEKDSSKKVIKNFLLIIYNLFGIVCHVVFWLFLMIGQLKYIG